MNRNLSEPIHHPRQKHLQMEASMIIIKPVQTKKGLRTFVSFPNKLYKNNEYYVPELVSDAYNTLHMKKNPAYAFCDAAFLSRL